MNEASHTKSNRIYFKNLDALRFLAAFGVIIFHFFREINGLFPALENNAKFNIVLAITDKGRLGVNFFFVLSGFLISYLIFEEIQKTGRFSLGKFLGRRILRIWPLYFIVGLLGFVLFPSIIEGFSTSHQALNYFFFLANFDEIYHGGEDAINFLTSPWSVAVEEQFYLFWGIVFAFIFKSSKKSFPLVIIVLYTCSFLFRWRYYEAEKLIYYHTLAVFQDILTGGILAWVLFYKSSYLDKLKQLKTPFIIFIYCLGFILCLLKNNLFQGQLIVFERAALSLFFAFIIHDQIRGEYSLFKLGKIKPFNYLGKISYGLYMYHLVVFYLLNIYFNHHSNGLMIDAILYFSIGMLGTIVIASTSYHFIEKWFLKLKMH